MKVIVDYDAYNLAHIDVYKAINVVANYYRIEIIQLKWTHFYNFCSDVLRVHFIKFPLGEELSKHLSGCIVPINGIVTIAYNSNMIINRRFFTICHEIVHRFCDMKDLQNARSFEDYLKLTSIDPKEDFIEYRANVGAGLLMCNDDSLTLQLYSGKSFEQLREYFYMSKSAMYFRLTEYVIYTVKVNPYNAQNLVRNYIRGDRTYFDKNVAPFAIPYAERILSKTQVPKRMLAIYR